MNKMTLHQLSALPDFFTSMPVKILAGFPGAVFVSLTMITNNACCQETEKSKVYEIRNSIAVYPCLLTGKRIYPDDRFSTPPSGAKFMLVRPLGTNNDTLIIRYLVWNKEKDSILRKYYNDPIISGRDSLKGQLPGNSPGIDDATRWPKEKVSRDSSGKIFSASESYENKIDKYFLIQRYDLDSNCIKVYNSGWRSTVFTIGLVTMPLKLRLGTRFDFQGNLSLGSTAGIKIRLSKYNSNYINLLLGTSISTITLDSFSTKGKLIGQPLTNIAVFSPSLGVVFEFGKAQAGIFYGWDILNKSTESKYEWIYNKKPWLSIGFGFSILNIDSKSNNQQSQNQ